MLGKTVNGTIDRPKGSIHPRVKGLVYPINYGYVDGVIAGDGAEQDIYLLGEDEPVTHFEGRVIAVFHRLNDNEDKWIVAKGAKDLTKQEILDSIDFQERFFDGELYMGGK
ncbi:MAG: inorganic pyrophosphatase [Ruminococcus sp.]|nr:inorganic pyrophosphatase [Ruminococcus sp.]MBR1749296.1 inorganic pyrophosphatase [Ruminococcus sp.]